MTDTIVALSSGAPPAAIGVVRLSGPAAFDAAAGVMSALPPARQARVRRLAHNGQTLDRALVLVFPAPDTATGEDLVELHVHGGGAVVRSVIGALLTFPDVREAQPGEFTRRSLQNGRLDLTQVEALADLLSAQTEAQRRAAILASEGSLRREIGLVEAELLMLSARVEMLLDFADEEDAGDDSAAVASVRDDLNRMVARLGDWTARPTVDQLHHGFRIVLAGPPNAGKSTLLNALSGREAAIVSEIAGTTRDRIEVSVSHGGLAFLLTDTAGLAERTDDAIEAIGIERARASIDAADVVLWLGDDPSPYPRSIDIHPRADLAGREQVGAGRLSLSARSGAGLDYLWSAIHHHVRNLVPPEDGRALNRRQHNLLTDVRNELLAAIAQDDPILIAHHLGRARAALHRVTGAADTEAMLDSLFGRFCIGK